MNSFQKIFQAFSLFYNRRADEGLELLDEALAEIRNDLFKCGEHHSFYLMKNSVDELILCFTVVDIELAIRIIASCPMLEQIECHSDFLAAYLAAVGDMASAAKVLRYAVSGRACRFPINIMKYREIAEKYERDGVLAKINRHIEQYREVYRTNPRNKPDKAIADELNAVRGWSQSNLTDEHNMAEALGKAEHSSSDEGKYTFIEKSAEYANRSDGIVRVLKVYRRISDPGYKFVSALKIAEIMSTSGRRRSAKNFMGKAIGLIKKIEWQPAGILFLYEFRKAIERINDIELLLACVNRHNGLLEELRPSLKYFIIDKDAESIRKTLPLINAGDPDIVNCYIENLLLAHLRSGETDIFNRIVTEVKDLGMEFMEDEVANIEKL
jgi:tetratricopeptide (TPR) repeat protein